MITELISAVWQGFENLLGHNHQAREMACRQGLSDDEVRALIWMEQAGMMDSKVHKLRCLEPIKANRFPDEREAAEAGGFYFAGL